MKSRLSDSILQLAAFPSADQGKQVALAVKHRESLYLLYFFADLKGRIKFSFNNAKCLLSPARITLCECDNAGKGAWTQGSAASSPEHRSNGCLLPQPVEQAPTV